MGSRHSGNQMPWYSQPSAHVDVAGNSASRAAILDEAFTAGPVHMQCRQRVVGAPLTPMALLVSQVVLYDKDMQHLDGVLVQ